MNAAATLLWVLFYTPAPVDCSDYAATAAMLVEAVSCDSAEGCDRRAVDEAFQDGWAMCAARAAYGTPVAWPSCEGAEDMVSAGGLCTHVDNLPVLEAK